MFGLGYTIQFHMKTITRTEWQHKNHHNKNIQNLKDHFLNLILS